MDDNNDIKELKAQNEALKARLQHLENILEQIPAHIYWYDKDLRFQGCNQNQARSAGLQSPDEIINTKVEDYLPIDIANEVNQNSQQVLDSEKQSVTQEHYVAASGDKRQTYLSCKSPLYDKNKKLQGIIGTSIDISELIEKQKKLIVEKDLVEQTLDNIISILPGHIYWLNKEGYLQGCNHMQAIALGYKRTDETIGKTIDELLPLEQAQEINRINQEVMKTKKTITAEEEATFNDGTTRIFLSKKAPLVDSKNNVIGCVGVSFDITDRKNTENELEKAKIKAETANELKNIFIANISHDIRTPLHAVIGLTELLKMKEHPKEQDDTISALLQSSRSLLKLVEDILNFAKIESELSVNMQEFNLNEELQNVIDTASVNAESKHIQIKSHIDDNIPTTIIHDAVIINRIILNLLSNATKFCENNEICIEATCLKKTSRQCEIQISVIDKGIGIAEDQLPYIFERFFRGKPSYEGKYEGTGLGLSIVKQLADSINADISVQSQEGEGSTFSLKLTAKCIKPKQSKKKASKKTVAITKAKILLVEDDKLAQKYIQSVFAEHKISICIANNGQEALTLAEQPFDVIFMDIGLPDMSGFDVAKAIKAKHPHCKIIILTAHARDTDIYQTLNDDDLDGFLQKPASSQELLSALEDTLGSTSKA